jgi:arsenate reductase
MIRAMTEHPKLIERPIVINKEKAIIGRPPENIKYIL